MSRAIVVRDWAAPVPRWGVIIVLSLTAAGCGAITAPIALSFAGGVCAAACGGLVGFARDIFDFKVEGVKDVPPGGPAPLK